jgi:thioesterase domain-containing protein
MPLTALQREGRGNPFFCIPGADENPYYLVDLAKALGQDRPFYVPRDPRGMEERGVYTLEEHASYYREVIQSAKPRGPYLLGGHCYGGILAYEIARQLTSMGEQVELLALFEVPTPGYPKVVGNWKRYVGQIGRLLRGEAQASWRDVLSHAGVVAAIWRRDLVSALRRRFFRTGLRGTIAQVETPGFNRNFAAARSYVPGLLNARVVQFIAAHEPHSTQVLDDPRMGWRESIVGEGFSVVEVPTLATEMFKPPYTSDLARLFKRIVFSIDRPRVQRVARSAKVKRAASAR